jgi:hypothetical protein
MTGIKPESVTDIIKNNYGLVETPVNETPAVIRSILGC